MTPALLERYNKMDYRHASQLIESDILAGLKRGVCPFCAHKLYEMRFRALYWCKAQKCPWYRQEGEHFKVSKDKLENVLRIGLRK
jgi:hypothetical protein